MRHLGALEVVHNGSDVLLDMQSLAQGRMEDSNGNAERRAIVVVSDWGHCWSLWNK